MAGFAWVSGWENISSYKTESGFASDFCSKCGSPMPNKFCDGGGYWVPAGLLENVDEIERVAHLFLDSRAAWDKVSEEENCLMHQTMPDREEIEALLGFPNPKP